MVVDDLFTKTDTDLSRLQHRQLPLSGTFKDAKEFNDACVSEGYDLMLDFEHGIGFRNSREKKLFIKNFIGRFETYLDTIYSEHSPKFIINDPKKEFEVIWWIKHPKRFKDFLKLLRYIDRYIQSYWGSWTNTGVQVVTASNRKNLRNLRVLIPPFGRLFEYKTLFDFNENVKFNIRNNFTLFWNNLNQQNELFLNTYYGNEVDSINNFVKIFSDFAAREMVRTVSRCNKNLSGIVDYYELKQIVADCLTEKFE